MNSAQIRIFEKMHHECFCGFLKRLYGVGLPAEGLAVDGEEGEAYFADLGGTSVSVVRGIRGEVWGKVEGGDIKEERGRERRLTRREKGSRSRRRSVERWYRRISRRAMVPGL